MLDDDADILEIISYILTDQGYEVVTLENGDDLLYNIRKFHPDLVLMDVMLGNLDGRLLCSELKHQPETCAIPVILISASHDLAKTLHQDGAPNDFIAKPFDIFSFLQKVEMQLAG